MRQAQAICGIVASGSAALLAAQPVWAAATRITAVELNRNGEQLELMLETQAGDERPQIFTVSRGNDLVADIWNTQLNLKEGNSFQQANPMPGITAIKVNQLDSSSIRITVQGAEGPPKGQILQSQSGEITLGIQTASTSEPEAPASSSPATATLPELPTAPPSAEIPDVPVAQAQTPAPEPAEPEPQPTVPTPEPDVLFPDPEITIEGEPTPAAGTAQPITPVPPTLPRAVPPPVGDIAISNINPAPTLIDLGTAVRVPRLVLREAPIREVLALLARSAGLNLAFTGEEAAEGEAEGAQATISLDLEDEAVQDVFNYVLQLSGFQANRVGRTIFVGARLPQAARDIITRSFRMNQVSAASAAAFLSAQGAETQRIVEEVTIQTVGEGAAARTVETRETNIQPLAAQEGNGPLLLRGLSVVTDERLNAVTLIGEPRQIQIAASFLTQLDLRRRQVAVNVKVLDIDLSATDDFNTSFRFGVGNDVLINFSPGPNVGDGFGVTVAPDDIVNNDFFAQLLTQIQSGNGKILTDPTLVVQEGETAQINLTREVVGNIERTREAVDDGVDEITVEADIVEVGLILNINVERIDDNGFITLAVNPEVTSIAEEEQLLLGDGDENTITLRSVRRLTSGRIRLRDSQTLILTGIIQDQEQTNIFKVPILGDLPIIGALFRDTQRDRTRSEVIVVLTPQILDDSENAGYGYNYTPDPETRRRLERRGFETQED